MNKIENMKKNEFKGLLSKPILNFFPYLRCFGKG